MTHQATEREKERKREREKRERDERERERERERASTAERGETHVGTKRGVRKHVAAYHHRGITAVTRQARERERKKD